MKAQNVLIGWHCILIMCISVLLPLLLRAHDGATDSLCISFVFALIAIPLSLTSSIIYHTNETTETTAYWTHANLTNNLWSAVDFSVNLFENQSTMSIINSLSASIVLVCSVLMVNQSVFDQYSRTKTKCKARCSVSIGLVLFALLTISLCTIGVLYYPLIQRSTCGIEKNDTLKEVHMHSFIE